MKSLLFSTGNASKFLTASHACAKYGIELLQKELAVAEIQEENALKVALDKAAKVYALVHQPVIISDDSWSFAGLNGFPGVYMHSMNAWLTPEDFLRLTLPLTNREATLTQHVVYSDQAGPKVFTHHTKGSLLPEIRGQSQHSSHTVITLEGDNGLSIAEAYEQAADKSARQSTQIWQEFAEWFQQNSN